MNRKIAKTFALGSYAMVVVLGVWSHAQAQDAKTPYPSMAPLDQYLMERNAEIALARSAARRPSRAMPRSWFWTAWL